MSDTTFKVINAAGVASSLALSGLISSISLITIPVLQSLAAPDPQIRSAINSSLIRKPTPLPTATVLRIWSAVYARGKSTAPPMAIFTILCHGISAYSLATADREPSSIPAYLPPTIAGILTIAIIPFTFLGMEGKKQVNGVLQSYIAKGEEGASEAMAGEVRKAVGRWGVTNAVRGVLPLVGGAIGLWGLMNN